MALHPERQGLDPGEDEEGVERTERRAEIAQGYRARGHAEGHGAEGLVEGEAVIGRGRLAEGRELVVLEPVEAAGLDQRAAHRVAMAAEELGQRVDHEVGAPLEGAAQIRRRHGVVDDQRYAGIVGDGGDGLDVDHDAARVGQVLDEDRLASRRQRAAEIGGIGRIHHVRGPAHAGEAVGELGDGAAVELVRGDELVARLEQGVEQQQLRAMAGAGAQPRGAVLEPGDTLLEHRDRRVGKARVYVAEGLQVEQRRRLVDIVEHVGGGLEDRRRPRSRGGVGRGAGMDGQGLEPVLVGFGLDIVPARQDALVHLGLPVDRRAPARPARIAN